MCVIGFWLHLVALYSTQTLSLSLNWRENWIKNFSLGSDVGRQNRWLIVVLIIWLLFFFFHPQSAKRERTDSTHFLADVLKKGTKMHIVDIAAVSSIIEW